GIVLPRAGLGLAQVAVRRRRNQRDAAALLRGAMRGQGGRRQRAEDGADDRRRRGLTARLLHGGRRTVDTFEVELGLAGRGDARLRRNRGGIRQGGVGQPLVDGIGLEAVRRAFD